MTLAQQTLTFAPRTPRRNPPCKCKYVKAVIWKFRAHGWRLTTGWHVGTLAECEPQLAMYLLRQRGVTVTSRRIPGQKGWEYLVPQSRDRRKCLEIVA